MKQKSMQVSVRGVSVITCTKRASYLYKLFRNFARQKWKKKELIIIINNDMIRKDKYLKLSKKYQNVFVFRFPGSVSLGKCLNFGVGKAKYQYVAKFDDDDYYAPNYLKEAIKTFNKTQADVIGKKAFFVWLSGKQVLVLRSPQYEHKSVTILPGATLVFKKTVFKKVKFPDVGVGEDDGFCRKCKSKGFKLYSGGRYNFVAIRRKFSRGHTWIISEDELMRRNVKVFPNVKNYKAFVMRS